MLVEPDLILIIEVLTVQRQVYKMSLLSIRGCLSYKWGLKGNSQEWVVWKKISKAEA